MEPIVADNKSLSWQLTLEISTRSTLEAATHGGVQVPALSFIRPLALTAR
jgi:hypothetical protein